MIRGVALFPVNNCLWTRLTRELTLTKPVLMFMVEAALRGYHVYKAIWEPHVDS